ncbi:MAG: hypothetical protein CMA42_02715 [Euryarchaeota archaeon]|nr:hypothetical protein [Euryarchaeota archaeon]
MQIEFEIVVFGLFLMALLYSAVGHGGASGYLAILSLSVYANEGDLWLKQYAWFLNLIVAGIAFFNYRKEGFHNRDLTWPFLVTSIPFTFFASSLKIGDEGYNLLLSLFLIYAAWKLLMGKKMNVAENKTLKVSNALLIGGIIGLTCGLVGIGGGILLSPILIINGWAKPKTAAATSAIFIWLNSLAGIIGSSISQHLVDLGNITPFVLAVLLGGFIGSKYGSKNAPQNSIKYLLSAVLLIAASKRILEIL